MSQSNAPTASAFTDNRLIDAMIYHFSLQMAALFAGAILCLLGVFGFATESSARGILAAFPRSRGAGIAVLSIGLAWSCGLRSSIASDADRALRAPFFAV